MYLTKFWLFLLSLVAAAALALAFVMPTPAARQQQIARHQKLATACGLVEVLLADQARKQVGQAALFASSREVITALEAATGADEISEGQSQQLREILAKKLASSYKAYAPDLAILLDGKGRVVARLKLDEKEFGDVLSGRPLVDDALNGYVSDDVWFFNQNLYLMRGAPVIRRDPPVGYVGALVIGYTVNSAMAAQIAAKQGFDLAFFVGKDIKATSTTLTVDGDLLQTAVGQLSGERGNDCHAGPPLVLSSGSTRYGALVARLPGDAGNKRAYYSVLIESPEPPGFWGTLAAMQRSDVMGLPWPLIGGLAMTLILLGSLLLFFEGDRPARRLAASALALSRAEGDRLEERLPGRFGSVARSVNIHIDKLAREAKTAKQDLDGLLGPSAPGGGAATIDLLATAMPALRGPAAPPPPSEFKFHDPPARLDATPVRTPPNIPVPKPPTRMGTGAHAALAATMPASLPQAMPQATPAHQLPVPQPAAFPQSPPTSLRTDEEMMDADYPTGVGEVELDPAIAAYFKQVFEQFINLKKTCGEPIAGVTYAKFSSKLERNRAELMSKTGCRDVRFTVYVKDGKAALKASPLREG